MGAKVMDAVQKYYDNSLENIGAWNSYTWIGPQWAQASTAPSRLMKAFPSEGGILVPCIVKAPQFRSQFQNGGFSRAFVTCMDVFPTILDMLDIHLQASQDQSSLGQPKVIHRGKSVHAPRGVSWLPYYRDGQMADPEGGEACSVHKSTEVFGWEMLARSALRQGQWKIVHIPEAFGGVAKPGSDEGWELFNVEADPGETEDLADRYPEKLAELTSLWEEYVRTTQIIWGDNASLPGLSKQDRPDLYLDDTDLQRNWIQCSPGKTLASASA